MLNTKRKLVNPELINSIIMDIVKSSYEDLKGEPVLLCLDCLDVDLYIVTSDHDEFDEAIKENFELDENFEIIDYDGFRELMEDLNEIFVLMHSTSGLFDYFAPGEYEVNGDIRIQENDYLAPNGIFFAPFEDALIKR